jgi:hypothetical protein
MTTERTARRLETAAVRRYLEMLAGKPRATDRAVLEVRRAELQRRIATAASPVDRLPLVQARVDVDDEMARLDVWEARGEVEAEFVKVAASWAERHGIGAKAFREVGVPADVIRQAGLRARDGRQTT